MGDVLHIDRSVLLNNTDRLVWLYSQTGYGKTILMQQYFQNNADQGVWLCHDDVDLNQKYQCFLENHDGVGNTLYIDDIHLFVDEWLAYFFENLPNKAKVIISSQCFKPDVALSLSTLNQFQILNYQSLRFTFDQVGQLTGGHHSISIKDVYELTQGWPVLVNLVSRKLDTANDIEHLKNIVNSPPNSLANFANQQIISRYQESFRPFLLLLAIVDVLPTHLFNHIEQMALSDFVEHELNGFIIQTDLGFQLIPLLKHACLTSLYREQPKDLYTSYFGLAERFLAKGDIKSAIVLMLQIGEKEKAISFLTRIGGLLEWIRHGLTSLIELKNLFNAKDTEQYETVAWLDCIVNYKQGHVNRARQIISLYWQKDNSEQLIWTVADAIVQLNEGRIFEDSHLSKLHSLAKQEEQSKEQGREVNAFSRALIKNLLIVTWLQVGNNNKTQTALIESEKYYRVLHDAQYAQTFIKIHQAHSAILDGQLSIAKQRLNITNTEIQTYFSKDKSIRIAAKIVKLELNYLTGLLPAIARVDQLIRQLDRSESWFDSYAILYSVAVKLAILQKKFSHIPKWFAIAYSHLQANFMEYLDQLLSQLAQLVIFECPELTTDLDYYVIKNPTKNISKLPWRLQAIELELMWKKKQYDRESILAVMQQAKENENILLYSFTKTIDELSYHPKFLSINLVNELSELQLIGMLLRMRAHISVKKFKTILKAHNRLGLLDVIEGARVTTSIGLSAKEQQIHKLLCANLRNKAIALELDISEQTVKFHLKNIYRKLGVKSRKEAALKSA